MRVLMVLVDFPALSETFVLDQVTGLIDRGFEVDILAARARRETTMHPDIEAYGLLDRVRYVDWKAPKAPRLLRWARICFDLARQGQWKLLEETVRAGWARRMKRPSLVGALQLISYAKAMQGLPRPDVVLCHFGPNGEVMVRLRRALKETWPVATFFHGYDISVLLNEKGPRIYDRLFRDGDMFLAVSALFRQRLLELGTEEKRTVVHRMGVRPDSETYAAASRTKGPQKEFVFISVGRLVEKKGLEYAVRAVAQCRERDPRTAIQLLIVGDGPLLEDLRETIRRLGLEGAVRLAGSVPRETIKHHLLAANAFVLPSVTAEAGDMEGIPVAITEAMAAGLPVVSTRHSGIPEVVENGVTGLLVAERDVDALAQAMHLVACDHELASRMGRAARAKVERHLDLDGWNDLLAERITTLVGRPNDEGVGPVPRDKVKASNDDFPERASRARAGSRRYVRALNQSGRSL